VRCEHKLSPDIHDFRKRPRESVAIIVVEKLLRIIEDQQLQPAARFLHMFAERKVKTDEARS